MGLLEVFLAGGSPAIPFYSSTTKKKCLSRIGAPPRGPVAYILERASPCALGEGCAPSRVLTAALAGRGTKKRSKDWGVNHER